MDSGDTKKEAVNSENGSEPNAVSVIENVFRPIEFRGNTKEYFGIWISNLVLTIITLGIYSSWAKVRRKKYFLNNSQISDASLNYHATGVQLLKGRLIALAVIIVNGLITIFFPLVGIVTSIAILFALPWVINQSMKFNARMTSWRNVRFNWRGTYWKSFWFFMIGPLLGLISFVFLPYFIKNYYQYYAQYHSFGTTDFNASSRTSKYFLALILTVWPGLFFVLLGIGGSQGIKTEFGLFDYYVLVVLLVFVISAITFTILQTLCRNILVRTLSLGQAVTFDSKLKPLVVLWISVTNLMAVIFSLGLLRPWAAIRLYRYVCHQTQYRFEMDDTEFVDTERSKLSSFGEEFAGLEGIDISI